MKTDRMEGMDTITHQRKAWQELRHNAADLALDVQIPMIV